MDYKIIVTNPINEKNLWEMCCGNDYQGLQEGIISLISTPFDDDIDKWAGLEFMIEENK